MTKRNKTIIILIVMCLLVTAAGVSFAWFIEGYLSDKFSFAVAFVESKVSLYRAEDNNYDGIPEIGTDGKPLYTFLGDSDNGSVKLDDNGNPIIGNNGPVYDGSVKVRFDIRNMLPTQIYVWKIVIRNVGDVKAKINADITVPLVDSTKKSGIDVLALSVNGGNKIYSGNTYSLNESTGKYSQNIMLIVGDPIEYSYKQDEVNPYSIKEYILAIEFESLENLNLAGVGISADDYCAYMGREYANLELSIRLEDDNKY